MALFPRPRSRPAAGPPCPDQAPGHARAVCRTGRQCPFAEKKKEVNNNLLIYVGTTSTTEASVRRV